MRVWLLLCLLIFPREAVADICEAISTLRIAHAKQVEGRLSGPELTFFLSSIDPKTLPAESEIPLTALLKAPLTTAAFGQWAEKNLDELAASAPGCQTFTPGHGAQNGVGAGAAVPASAGASDGGRRRDGHSLLNAVTTAAAPVIATGATVSILLILAIVALITYFKNRRIRGKRYFCSLDVEIASISTAGVGKIVDISESGCKIKIADFPLEISDRADLSTRFFEVPAKVIWCNQHFIGLQFRQTISKDVLAQVVSHRKSASVATNAGLAPALAGGR